MKKYYGRKAWVPDNCPKCNRLRSDLKPRKYLGDTLKLSYDQITKITEDYWGGYHRGLDKKHWFWRFPRWFGNCLACNLEENLRGPSLLQKLSLKPKPKDMKPLTYELRLTQS